MRAQLLLSFLPFTLGMNAASSQNATSSALLYAYPLLAWEQLAGSVLDQTDAVNSFHHATELQTADSHAVVTPNVDTLYSVMIFDLSRSDLVLTIPKIPASQFALFSCYDPYGNNFANIGPDNSDTHGEYRFTRRSDPTTPYGYDADKSDPQYLKGTITSPTTYGALFVRWLVNATNLNSIHTYQNATSIRSVPRPDTSTLPTLASLLQGVGNASTVAAHVLDLLAKYGAVDGPEVPTDSGILESNMKLAGISEGVYTPVEGVNLTEANTTALTAALVGASGAQIDLGNGWKVLNPSETGDYGTKYDVRTAVAVSAYELLKSPKAIYPSWSDGSTRGSLVGSGGLDVGANESYLYTFSRPPPLGRLGFWSLTAYHNEYLIPNDRGVYSIGDRSGITYPGGQPLYGENSTSDSGEFQILIQPADVIPPANWTSNWLPAPSGGGSMSALLRFYEARDDLLNGTYVYPKVTKQAAIVGHGGDMSNVTVPSPYRSGAGISFASTAKAAIAISGITVAVGLS